MFSFDYFRINYDKKDGFTDIHNCLDNYHNYIFKI